VITARVDRHHRLSALLAVLGDVELMTLLDAGRVVGIGVGGDATVIDLDGVPVFAKRVPLTSLELAHPHSTANLFELPSYCQYGMGGPSFNAWRELAANQLVTDGVLAGETGSFPLLHHWRVLPGRPPVADEHLDIDEVVAAYGGSPAVRARLAALAAASYSLVLFSEYLPYSLADWLADDPVGKAPLVEQQFAEIVDYLRDRELLHLDGHFGNLRADGERIYLTDFGLATSPRFSLSAEELEFVERNASHDAGYASMRLVNWLVTAVCGVRLPALGGPVERNEYIERWAAGDTADDVPTVVAEMLNRHAPAAAKLNAFYWKLFDGDLTTEFPG